MPRADNGLRALIHSKLCKPDWLWTSVETGLTAGGVPDSFWAHRPSQRSGWIEHKATTGWHVEIRPHQCAWIDTYTRAGVRVHIAVRASGTGSSQGHGDSLWLVRGESVRELMDRGLAKLADKSVVGKWYGPPPKWKWAEIAGFLTR